MDKTDNKYQQFVGILKEELVPAMGCTEPIAIAYASAKGKELLGEIPKKVVIDVSGNIIKNVKSVVVPNTGGLKGISVAAAAGIIAGKADMKLEVISQVSELEKIQIKEFLNSCEFLVNASDTSNIFDIFITLYGNTSFVKIRIVKYHTNIVYLEKDGQVIIDLTSEDIPENGELQENKQSLDVETILEFADSVDLDDVRQIIGRQIEYNMAIAEEGLKNDYGANIGSVILKSYKGNDIKIKAKAYAAAGSDARMSGCELPVVIVSGSGNQGITTSIPVIVYARELKASEEQLYRALVVANLITIHQKTFIGRLSAFCGAVSAGCGAAAGIVYLQGGDYRAVSHTIVNGIAIASGIVCDGAKASCAAKIATAVDAGLLGACMYKENQQFRGGDGLILKGVENTIANIGRLGREGMRETDKEIIRMMVNS